MSVLHLGTSRRTLTDVPSVSLLTWLGAHPVVPYQSVPGLEGAAPHPGPQGTPGQAASPDTPSIFPQNIFFLHLKQRDWNLQIVV